MTDLSQLLEKVRTADEGSRELDFWVETIVVNPIGPDDDYTFEDVMSDFNLLGPEGMTIDGAYATSLDAIVALSRSRLPDYDFSSADMGDDGCWAEIWVNGRHGGTVIRVDCATEPLSRVAAFLSALISKEKADG